MPRRKQSLHQTGLRPHSRTKHGIILLSPARMEPTTCFIVHSTHVAENLLHHKASDVRRILEDKGFTEDGAKEEDGATHFYPDAGTPQSSKQTKILFDDGGFVMEEGGVTHTE